MVSDARSQTKTHWDTYARDAQLTKDNGSTEMTHISQYANPPYPLKMVFYNPKNIDLVISIDTPVTSPVVDWDGSIYGYNEAVPVLIQTVRKQGIDPNKARWKGDAELRYALETYPLGSYRSMGRSTPFDQDMGGWMIYGIKTFVSYSRDTT